MENTVYVVHCVDAEGPLFESLEATFERINKLFGIQLEPTPVNLKKLQNREFSFHGLETAIQKLVSSHLLTYLDTWDKIDDMLYQLLDKKCRMLTQDSYGGGWIYNWFCLAHVGYETNPRRRDIGYHNIFDHYQTILKNTNSRDDGIQFHYHPMPFSRAAHHCATHYFAHSDTLFQILGRRIIDRCWFPCVYRPGFHTIRPDSHWFLEQYIPFDYSNQSYKETSDQPDMSFGRYGDWREAPITWEPYHPDHDNYQTKGNCRRLTARCLNMRSRMRCLTQDDVDLAFMEAEEGKPVVLSFTNHDFRSMYPEIQAVYALLKNAEKRYPTVKFKFCEAREAMRLSFNLPQKMPFGFNIDLKESKLSINTEHNIFGPQPFFVIKTKNGQYYHDNLDFQKTYSSWSYYFDDQNIPIGSISNIGMAANDSYGNTAVVVLDIDDKGKIKKRNEGRY